MVDDPALDSLFLPLRQGLVAWPAGSTLFLRARSGIALAQVEGRALVCQQSFRPQADQLRRDGFEVVSSASGHFGLILLLPPRQRDEGRALLAKAMLQLEPDGCLLLSAQNNEGARSVEADLRRLAGTVQSLSKNHCRVMWLQRQQAVLDEALLQDWLQEDEPRAIADGRFLSRPGLFAWDRVDQASALLADALPANFSGRAADLGAGYGYLGAMLLARCPAVSALDLYEAEARALELARDNLAAEAARVALGFHWHDVCAGLPQSYDVIISNPPFHVSRADQPDLGRRFIAVAAEALRPGGRLWLVANRHLPYEAILTQAFASWRVVRDEQGFKVIEAIKATA